MDRSEIKESEAPSGWKRWIGVVAVSVAVAIAVGITCYLFWPLPRHLSSHHSISVFGDSQVWCFDQIDRMLTGREPLSGQTSRAGYPYLLDARFIAWIPAMFALPFNLAAGPVAAYNLVLLLTPALTALAAYAFFRKTTDSSPWIAAPVSLAYALCPYMLSCLANGQVEKAQLWTYPLYLLALWRAMEPPLRWKRMALVPLAAAMAIFTDPYFGLFIPLFATPLGLGRAMMARGRRASALATATIALALTAASFLAARAYYRPSTGEPVVSMFRSAGAPLRLEGRISILPSPVAQPRATFFGPWISELWSDNVNHVTYIVLPLLIVAAALCVFRFRGRAPGIALALIGVALAFGPRLVVNDYYQTVNGHPYYLPAEVLERIHYPLSEGGQYYRAIAIASLGLTWLVAGGLSRWRAWLAIPAAWLVAGVAVHDGQDHLRTLFPRPAAEIPGLDLFRAMADHPEDGAVLALPFQSSESRGGTQLMQAAVHGRSTSAVAKYVRYDEVRAYSRWLRDWEKRRTIDPQSTPAFLKDLGFRYVVLDTTADRERRDVPGFSEAELTRLLGAPRRSGLLRVWDLGATRLRPQKIFLEPLPPPASVPPPRVGPRSEKTPPSR